LPELLRPVNPSRVREQNVTSRRVPAGIMMNETVSPGFAESSTRSTPKDGSADCTGGWACCTLVREATQPIAVTFRPQRTEMAVSLFRTSLGAIPDS
jgi:hypothetical protein